MADKKGNKKVKPTGAAPDPVLPEEPDKEGYTSTRIFAQDQAKLAKLAALRGEAIATTFRRVFGKLLDSALLAAAESTAGELRNPPVGP